MSRMGRTAQSLRRVKPEPGETAPEVAPPAHRRLPYEKPAVTWDQPLETQPALMAGCAKTPAGGVACVAANFS
jgi:hypothetical protein